MPKQFKASPSMDNTMPSVSHTTTAGLPTPAQSTEIHAKPTFSALSFDGAFTLPPAAISSPPNSRNSSVISSDKAESDSSYNPDTIASSAASKGKQAAKRKTSTGKSAMQNSDYTVPPPPTRSRKIIQMKPRKQSQDQEISFMAIAPDLTAVKEEKAHDVSPTNTSTGTKRKQAASATTAQGRKMARKTAHSLIERRRRSKMNEEFGVLKDMIPACTGQDMHKLAILQASIDYMRYLEKCLADLKTAHSSCPSQTQMASPSYQQISRPSTTLPSTRASSTTPPSEDSDMLDLPPIREVLASHPTTSARQYNHTSQSQPQPQSSRLPPISPAINPLSNSVHNSPLHRAQYQPPPPLQTSTTTASSSTHPSPLFRAQQHRNSNSSSSSINKLASFSLTSPIVPPMTAQRGTADQQEEATAALLMLNTDRRSWSERGSSFGAAFDRRTSNAGAVVGSSARSMSVRDLLTG